MNIRKIDGLYNSGLHKIEGVDGIYYTFDNGGVDFYEITELKELGHQIKGNEISFFFYPEGKIYTPFKKEYGIYYDSYGVLYNDSCIYFMQADFNIDKLTIYRYNILENLLEKVKDFDLKMLDTYNLRIYFEPLSLCSSNNERLEIYYPEELIIKEESNESFIFRDNDKFYFTAWFEENVNDVENYKYYEMYVIKDKKGNIIETGNGVIEQMPEGKYIIV